MIIDKLSRLFENQPYLKTLYQALFITTYFGLFRIGEMTLTPVGHAVKVEDVHVGRNKNKLMFILHTSKTHNRGSKPQIVKISALKTQQAVPPGVASRCFRYCPFKLMQSFINCRKSQKSPNEQFFVFSDRSPVSADHFRVVIKHTIQALGLNPVLYSRHSLCVGRACDLLAIGVSVETIKKLGRWKSNAVYNYL